MKATIETSESTKGMFAKKRVLKIYCKINLTPEEKLVFEGSGLEYNELTSETPSGGEMPEPHEQAISFNQAVSETGGSQVVNSVGQLFERENEITSRLKQLQGSLDTLIQYEISKSYTIDFSEID